MFQMIAQKAIGWRHKLCSLPTTVVVSGRRVWAHLLTYYETSGRSRRGEES